MDTRFSVVLHDAYDERVFRELSVKLGRLGEVQEVGQKLLPHFQELLFDLYAALYKFNVVLRPEEELPAGVLWHLTVLRQLMRAPWYARLRESTLLEEERAARGAIALAREILRAIRRDALFDEEELLAFWEIRQEEEERAELLDLKESADELAREQKESRQQTSPGLFSAQEELEEELLAAERQHQRRRKEQAEKARALPTSLFRALSEVAQTLPGRFDEEEEAVEFFARNISGQGQVDGLTRLELGERLARSEKLMRLARLVGAFREIALATRRKRLERSVEEVYEVGRGRDLGRLVPSELVSLTHPGRRLDLLRRYTEGGLLSYSLRGHGERGRGPILVCLDVSSSMQGAKELWAKAVCLALSEIARRQNRAFCTICFSSPPTPLLVVETLSSRKGPTGRAAVDLRAVAHLAEHFPGGGTDFVTPLREALSRIQASGKKKADVVLITDGESQVPPLFREEFLKEKKKRDFSLYGVLVDRGGSSQAHALLPLVDRFTTVNRLTEEEAREIFLKF